MSTIKDVAEQAGVSVATVSRVVNHKHWVHPQTAERVWKAVQDLGYAPNVMAQGLRHRKTDVIGTIIANPSTSLFFDLFFSDVVRTVGSEVEKKQRNLALATVKGDGSTPTPRMVATRLIDGAIVAGVAISERLGEDLLGVGIPVVVIGRHLPNWNLSRVIVDNVNGAVKATRYLLDHGIRKIGMIMGPEEIYSFEERLKGFRTAMSMAGVPIPKDAVYRANGFRREDGYKGAAALLKGGGLEAVIVTRTEMSLGVMEYLTERKIRVPDDVLVIGDGPSIGGEIFGQSIGFVRTDTRDVGCTAVRLLLEAVDGTETGPVEITVARDLVVPDSWHRVLHSTERKFSL